MGSTDESLFYYGGHLSVAVSWGHQNTELTGLPQMNQKWVKRCFTRVSKLPLTVNRGRTEHLVHWLLACQSLALLGSLLIIHWSLHNQSPPLIFTSVKRRRGGSRFSSSAWKSAILNSGVSPLHYAGLLLPEQPAPPSHSTPPFVCCCWFPLQYASWRPRALGSTNQVEILALCQVTMKE